MFFTYPMESFVARHVLANLFYNGDMDGGSVGPNGEAIPEVKRCGCLGRREMLTIGIYVATLIPALIFRDLGPVLSLTGSIGASCIAYIGPGLVYLGVNGDDFLAYVNNMLQGKSYNPGSSNKAASDGNGQIELPVVGDASASMETAPEPSLSSQSKPWWYYLFGFPIWCAIASTGAVGTRQFLAPFESAIGTPLTDSENEGEVIGPCRRDYYISMFFVIFGVLALVVGVISNIYVELNDIFFTPT